MAAAAAAVAVAAAAAAAEELDRHEGVAYRIGGVSDLSDLHSLVMREFYPAMPLYQQLKADGDPAVTRRFLAAALEQRVSILAVDVVSGDVIGASVNTIDTSDAEKNVEFPTPAPEFAGQRLILRCVDAVESGVDCFARFKEPRAMSLKLLTVSAGHCRRGIGRRMWRLCPRLAAAAGLRLLTVSTESLFSQRIAEALGFGAVHRLRFADFVDGDGERPLAAMEQTPHQEAVMFAMLLSADAIGGETDSRDANSKKQAC